MIVNLPAVDGQPVTQCTICLKLNPPVGCCREREWPPRFPTEDVEPPQSSRLVVQVVAGESAERQHEITRESTAAYAARIGADYRVLTGDRWPAFPMFNKWRIGALAKRYDRTLYLDVDVVVKRDSPNVFDFADGFAAVDEHPDTALNYVAHGVSWIDEQSDQVCDSQGWPRVRLSKSFNGGVLAMDRGTAHVYSPPPRRVPGLWCADQLLISIAAARGEPVQELDWRWNCGFVSPMFWRRIEQAYFVHTNGCSVLDYRLSLLRAFVAGDFRYQRPPREQWLPRWRTDEDLRRDSRDTPADDAHANRACVLRVRRRTNHRRRLRAWPVAG